MKFEILFVNGSIVPSNNDDLTTVGIGVTHPNDDGDKIEPVDITDIVTPLILYAGQDPPLPLLSISLRNVGVTAIPFLSM